MRKIVTIGLGLFAAFALACGAAPTGDDSRASDGRTGIEQPSAPGKPAGATESPASATESKAAPVWSPTPKQTPADQTLTGRGDKILELKLHPDFLHIATITHTGRSNFVVWTVDASGDSIELLINEIGKYRGTRPLDLDETPAALRIEADGAWTVTVQVAQKAPIWTGKASGVGAAVLLVHPDALGSGLGTVTITHNGEQNFIVKAYGERNQLLVNEIGNYRGEKILPRGTVLLEIDADGAWTIQKS